MDLACYGTVSDLLQFGDNAPESHERQGAPEPERWRPRGLIACERPKRSVRSPNADGLSRRGRQRSATFSLAVPPTSRTFREKQTELRLARARELLATTDSKVAEVALGSGYQSTSLFGAMFKQRFGASPARWRERLKGKGRKPAKPLARRLRIVA